MMKKYITKGLLVILVLATLSSCKKYLDVVPDNVATIENAFTMRSQAQKFLFTCYSYMPKEGDLTDDPGILSGDEIWDVPTKGAYFFIARGFQKTISPYGDRWTNLYRALRDCNIFLENVGKVPDLNEEERARWIAEVKFLKAYYHFYLVRMYGPIPLIKTNLSIDAEANVTRVTRDPVDSCFSYIKQLLDEASPSLPPIVLNPTTEAGRITQPIALALKAKVLVTAASPLFNGNTDQSTLKNPDGTQLFNPTYSKAKWDTAAVACKKAIELCHSVGMKLYVYNPDFQQFNLTSTIKTQMNIRNSFAEKWNSEIIWANTQTLVANATLQVLAATWWDPLLLDNSAIRGEFSPPLKIVEQFYTKNGVPITEDKTWDYNGRYGLRTAVESEKLYIKKDFETAKLNFDREPRFYADLGFDGGIWYGQGKYDDSQDLFYLQAKFKQRNGVGKPNYGTVTGYYVKKYVHFQNVMVAASYSTNPFPWPVIRLSDLYLLYSEALNESLAAPDAEVYKYINLIRARAGLNSVESSWTNFSSNPSKYTNKDGMREIIHQERKIEFVFESQRLWDLRRWKEAAKELNQPITTWDLGQETSAGYYRPVILFNQTFGSKDYFWPISEANITANRNIVQNLGW
ncbi:RagB/SusD family nutrient uptake outer membrane protein [Pedobacter heparinus]|uniref:RagB/SusD domain protein n=1 Tax=Pedobacter heparinus (strain ATCC 13125 / DSM 2366 / CIP 104194 / JCM 7457 / NBRC 12017 / NCIMB 9290 / NRRL B-14731 / HIM 762-3) TaxID=485917 RepID=C6Y051_PEDHD|nr:RagB/SusD family nutrient uptake outer membrane protein [Pedobacter heparinus]ACU04763.1 RagB/SusD domain protein [Pedobacter heparinus DSM 2366]